MIVTGSANGTNNQITVDALARMNGSFKAICVVGCRDVSDAGAAQTQSRGFYRLSYQIVGGAATRC